MKISLPVAISARLFIFDWNGTLQDDALKIFACVAGTVSHFDGTPPSYEEWRGGKVRGNWLALYHESGVPTTVGPAELQPVYDRIHASLPDAAVFPDAVSTLRTLKSLGATCVLVSGCPKEILEAEVARHGLADLFDQVVPYVRLKAQAFLRLVAERGLPLEQILAVGDMVDDAEAARQTGIRAVLCPRGFNTREAIEAALPRLPNTRVIETLADLLTV